MSRRQKQNLKISPNMQRFMQIFMLQMIDLLREQLYQQQLSLSRDISYDEDDLDLDLQSPTSSIPSVAMSEPILAEVADIKETLMRTQLQHQKDLSKSFSDVSLLISFFIYCKFGNFCESFILAKRRICVNKTLPKWRNHSVV